MPDIISAKNRQQRDNLLAEDINSLFNRKSELWVPTVIQNNEIVVIRQNYSLGFISLGWFDLNKKILITNIPREDPLTYVTKIYIKELVNKFMHIARAVARSLNDYEKLNKGPDYHKYKDHKKH